MGESTRYSRLGPSQRQLNVQVFGPKLQERRRPFDVGEEQRDSAGRTLSHDPAE